MRPGMRMRPLRDMVFVFGGRKDGGKEDVFPTPTMRDPVTRMPPSRITSLVGLMVIIVACV
jgi:hypothetical protein